MCNIEFTQDKGIEIECFLATEHKEDLIINHYTKTLEITRYLFHETTNIWKGESTRLRKGTSKYNLYYFTMR